MIEIRLLTPEDSESFWQLRLESLITSPETFGSTYKEDSVRPMEEVKARLAPSSSSFILGACTQDGRIVGMLGFKQEQSIKVKHKGFLWGMYVNPMFRNQGIGKKLIVEAIKRAKSADGLEQINLGVVTDNASAKRLYQSAGFIVYGLEKNALKYNGEYYDEELMVYRL
ncbi:hypothetical protein SD71_20830 [Cohnella kolymensis]|uniref:N-acetyltransferase domain-containing protein n=1 Tax=Cohnella kolymensis TaxID=1590652 RepID=A0ABR4ZZB2_9BACL|nr:GNAT family N-acetyltransferase [Cohnella kolymensis]KIL34138.1 hypothetical protein SD71_20830 [Cohnella kolymensis]